MRAAILVSLGGMFLSLTVAGCGTPPNRLYGSLSDEYSLDFASTQESLIDGSLVVEYLQAGASPGQTSGKTAKLTVSLANLSVTPGAVIDLSEMVNGDTRGTLQRIVDSTVDFPLLHGTLSVDQAPAAGMHLTGHFYTTLSMPSGRTLNGDFDGTLVQK